MGVPCWGVSVFSEIIQMWLLGNSLQRSEGWEVVEKRQDFFLNNKSPPLDFSDSPVVKTLPSNKRGAGFISGRGAHNQETKT